MQTIYFKNYQPNADGINNDGVKLNQAILDCSKQGGGKVVVGGNATYRIGYLELQDNVELYLEAGAILKASSKMTDFYNTSVVKDTNLYVPSWENCEYDGKPSMYFIFANGKKNIKITGSGSIDGNEEIFYGNVTKWHIEGAFYPRVPLLCLEGCQNVTLTGIRLQNSGFWTTHLVGCKDVLIDGITIKNNLRMTNSDGIDPDHCQNVTIRNSYIEGADDAIVLKTTEAFKQYGSCENILVENCELISTSAAIKFGTESVSDFKNITFRKCNIHHSNRGISLQLRDCGNISDVTFEDITINTRRFSAIHWWGRAEAIAITGVRRNKDTQLGQISNVHFKGIQTKGENGILIYGEDNIRNISFEDVDVKIEKTTDWAKQDLDLRPSIYNVVEGKPAVLYLCGAKEVTFSNFTYEINANIKAEVSEFVFNQKIKAN